MRNALTRAVKVALCVGCVAVLGAQTRSTLDMYLIDVEGGNATLFVTPSGESLLIDTGNGGAAAARDAERIAAAAKDAGISRLDYLVTTHYHGDHFGAMAEVASRLPVGPLRRPRPERPAQPGHRHVPEHGVSEAPCGQDAHRGEARGHAAHARSRGTHRHLGRERPRQAAARRRRGEPGLRVREAAGSGSRRRTRSRSARM